MFQKIDEVIDGLFTHPNVDPMIADKLKAQADNVRDNQEDKDTRRGFVDSANNVLGALAEMALAAPKWVVGETVEVAGHYWKEVKQKVATAAATITVAGGVLGVAATAFFSTNAPQLIELAKANPEAFGWLNKFLELIAK